jgi:hypothetical protein
VAPPDLHRPHRQARGFTPLRIGSSGSRVQLCPTPYIAQRFVVLCRPTFFHLRADLPRSSSSLPGDGAGGPRRRGSRPGGGRGDPPEVPPDRPVPGSTRSGSAVCCAR